MAGIPSRIDPLSWAIFIDEPYPEVSEDELWRYPSKYPVMQPVIHETVHFWHSISTAQGIRLAFDCLKSMNALRFAAKQGIDLRHIDAEWTLDGYRPFEALSEFYVPGIRVKGPFGELSDERREPHLSPFHLFEGLARYWDLIISAGLTTDQIISALMNEQAATYSEAYRYAYETIGDISFILFPLFGYLALCTDDPVESFATTLSYYQEGGFDIPRGVDFQVAWLIAWDKAAQWGGVYPTPYAPMTTYVTQHKRYVKWKAKYAGLIPEDFPFTGHPILEDSVQNIMALARHKWPEKTDHEREGQILIEFVFPGNPDFRRTLVKGCSPPVVRFADGRCWISPTEAYRNRPEFFTNSMQDFSTLMGGAYGLISRTTGRQLMHKCPQNICPIHEFGLCGYVSEYPPNHATCSFFRLLKHEFGMSQS